MEASWQYEGDRGAGEGAENSQELVETVAQGFGDDHGEGDHDCPVDVLAPHALLGLWPALEEVLLYDNVRRVNHQRVREHQVKDEYDLNSGDDGNVGVGLGHGLLDAGQNDVVVGQDVPICHVHQLPKEDEEGHHACHHREQHPVEVLLVLADLPHRQDYTNALVGVDGEPDDSEAVGVVQGDDAGTETVLAQNLADGVADADTARHCNDDVGEDVRCGEGLDLPHPAERSVHEEGHAPKHPVQVLVPGQPKHEGENLVERIGDEVDVGGHEAHLRDDDRHLADDPAPLPESVLADLEEGGHSRGVPRLEQLVRADQGQHVRQEQTPCRECPSSKVEVLGQVNDSGANESLEQSEEGALVAEETCFSLLELLELVLGLFFGHSLHVFGQIVHVVLRHRTISTVQMRVDVLVRVDILLESAFLPGSLVRLRTPDLRLHLLLSHLIQLELWLRVRALVQTLALRLVDIQGRCAQAVPIGVFPPVFAGVAQSGGVVAGLDAGLLV